MFPPLKQEAKDLYLHSGKSQKEIAGIIGVSDRTIRNWIKENGWDIIRYRIQHPPATLSEGILMQLTNLQNKVLAKESGIPNIDEANIMHKLTICLYRVNAMPNLDHSKIISLPPDEQIQEEYSDLQTTIPLQAAEQEENDFPSALAEINAPDTIQNIDTEQDNTFPLPPESGNKPETNWHPGSYQDGNVSETPEADYGKETTTNQPKPFSRDELQKQWDLDAKAKGLWKAKGVPSDYLPPGSPEFEERAKKQQVAINNIKQEMRRNHDPKKRNNYW